MQTRPELIQTTQLRDPFVDNPECRCPLCGHTGPLMEAFSYLKAGFNGIRSGDPDDLDVQECGGCGAYLDHPDAADIIEPDREEMKCL